MSHPGEWGWNIGGYSNRERSRNSTRRTFSDIINHWVANVQRGGQAQCMCKYWGKADVRKNGKWMDFAVKREKKKESWNCQWNGKLRQSFSHFAKKETVKQSMVDSISFLVANSNGWKEKNKKNHGCVCLHRATLFVGESNDQLKSPSKIRFPEKKYWECFVKKEKTETLLG